mgnify:CR=1 FL=1
MAFYGYLVFNKELGKRLASSSLIASINNTIISNIAINR